MQMKSFCIQRIRIGYGKNRGNFCVELNSNALSCQEEKKHYID